MDPYKLFRPHWFVESVFDLTPDWLAERKLRALLLDVDCTLKRYREPRLGEKVLAWLETLRRAEIAFCLVSNGRSRRIGALADAAGVPYVANALKPFPFGCRRARARLGVPARETAMVGDQIFADIPAGRMAGLYTVLVRPIHPEEEPALTRLKRPFERFLLRRFGAY